MVGSEFSINTMKAWIHLTLFTPFQSMKKTEVAVSCCNRRGRYFISIQHENNHRKVLDRHYYPFTCIYILGTQLIHFWWLRTLDLLHTFFVHCWLLVFNRLSPPAGNATNTCLSISRFGDGNREKDTMGRRVYFTFCRVESPVKQTCLSLP